MKRKMLDLCSGFGGQSEYFLKDFDVLRIDNNPLLSDVAETVIMDIYNDQILDSNNTEIEYIHAGPTCLEFSTGYAGPRGAAQRAGDEDYWPTEGIRLVNRCKAIIDTLKPRFWSIENVKGSIIYLTPILGEPRLIIGPYVYWGNFPLFSFEATIPSKADKDKRHSPLRMNYRACAPIEISKAFHDAIVNQRSILEY